MPFTPASAVHRQVSRASHRLFVQTLLDSLVWCWTAALLTAVVWFLVQPLVLGKPDEWVRWAIAAGIFVIATGVGVALAWRRSPSHVAAALELDGRFQLRERVTTALTLAPEYEHSSVGQALLADANERVANVDVRTRFPVRLSRTALIVPGCGLLLGLVAYFYNPTFSTAEVRQPQQKDERKFVPAREIVQDVNNLKKLTQTDWFKNPKTEEEKKRRQMIEEALKIDPKNEEQQREQAEKIQQIKNEIKDRLDDLKAEQERKKELQDQLKKLGEKVQQDGQQGPAKDVQKALQEGDAEKAAEKMKELADKLKDDKLDEKEKQELQQQLNDLKQQLNDAADQKAQKDQLQKDKEDLKKEKDDLKKEKDELQKKKEDLDNQKKDGKGDKQEQEKQEQQLKDQQQALEEKEQKAADKQQALDKKDAQMKDNGDKLQDLKEIAKDLDAAKNDLDKGENKDAGKKLDDAAKKLEKMGGNNDKEMKQLKEGLGGGGEPKNLDRPFAEGGKMNSKDAKQKVEPDLKQGLHQVGEQTGGTFKIIKAADVQGHIERARQEAAQQIERQQIPEDAADFVKGYTDKLKK
jgi:hypothetical protein